MNSRKTTLSALTLAITLLSACTHPIVMDERYKSEVLNCNIQIGDKRTDKTLLTAAPATSYSFPEEYPIEKAVRNRLCQTHLAERDLVVYLEEASLADQGGFKGTQLALKLRVKGYDESIVSIQGDQGEYYNIGKITGYQLGLAIDDAVEQIVQMVGKQP